ncbi:MAG TPA: FecR family protein, partial [Polyangia bacterium]|nr:FecR family protein [Polyangia bacterium]
ATMREIQHALQSRNRRRAAVRWLTAGTVAAAAAVAMFIGWQNFQTFASQFEGKVASRHAPAPVPPGSSLTIASLEGSGASVEMAGGEKPAVVQDRIEPGALLRAPPSGHVVLALDTGTRLRIAASARTRVAELGAVQRFDLESGSLEAAVAKLKPGQRFIVATPDTEVEVKGTRFQLVVDGEPSRCEPTVRTRLTVQEGVVAVRHEGSEVRVAAGSIWPACPPAPEPEPAPAAAPAAAHRHAAARIAAADHARAGADPSTLPEQNDLFAAALAARRRGNTSEAIRWLDRLVIRYPAGQLADSARAEKRRLLEGADRD